MKNIIQNFRFAGYIFLPYTRFVTGIAKRITKKKRRIRKKISKPRNYNPIFHDLNLILSRLFCFHLLFLFVDFQLHGQLKFHLHTLLSNVNSLSKLLYSFLFDKCCDYDLFDRLYVSNRCINTH